MNPDHKKFLQACKDGNLAAVRRFLSNGVSIETRNEAFEGETGLIVAAENGHHELVEFLLSGGADVDAKTDMIPLQGGKYTALHLAAANGHLRIVRSLIDAKANIDAKATTGTPLHSALRNNHAEIAEVLLAAGADPFGVDRSMGRTLLHEAALIGASETVERLLNAGLSIDAQERSGSTALLLAATDGHEALVLSLLTRGANPRLKQHNGTTVLIWCVRGRLERAVEELIKRGVDVNERDDVGATALRYARREKCVRIARILKAAGATE